MPRSKKRETTGNQKNLVAEFKLISDAWFKDEFPKPESKNPDRNRFWGVSPSERKPFYQAVREWREENLARYFSRPEIQVHLSIGHFREALGQIRVSFNLLIDHEEERLYNCTGQLSASTPLVTPWYNSFEPQTREQRLPFQQYHNPMGLLCDRLDDMELEFVTKIQPVPNEHNEVRREFPYYNGQLRFWELSLFLNP